MTDLKKAIDKLAEQFIADNYRQPTELDRVRIHSAMLIGALAQTRYELLDEEIVAPV